MSDGGVSNHVAYKRFIADRKHYIKKYNINKLVGYIQLFKDVFLVFVRNHMPSSLMEYYRWKKMGK